MRDFGIIHTRFWEWAQELGLSDQAKLVAAYLLTCRHSNSLGCFRLPKEYVSADLGYSMDRVSKAYQELIDTHFLAYCEHSKYAFVVKYLLWNPPQNPKHAKGILKLIQQLPKSLSFLDKILESCEEYLLPYLDEESKDTLYHTLSIAYGYTDTDTGTDTDTEYPSSSQTNPSDELTNPVNQNPGISESHPELYETSRQFHLSQQQQHPNKIKTLSEKKIRDGANTLRLLIERDGYDFQREILPALKWAVRDEFWSYQLLSLSGIRKVGKNGEMKIVNVLASMERQQANPSKDKEEESKFEKLRAWKQGRQT